MCFNTLLIVFLYIVNAKTLEFSRKLWHIRAHRDFYFPEERSGEKTEYKYKSFKSRLNPYIVPWFASPSINTKQLQLIRREQNLRVAEQMEK